MKSLILVINLFALPAMAVTTADVNVIKNAEGLYTFESTTLSPEQKKQCLEGVLKYNPQTGTLLLSGTPLATELLVTPAKKNAAADKTSDCEDKITSTFNKNVLEFASESTCKTEPKISELKRQITFAKESLSYTQKAKVDGKETTVTCRLKKTTKPADKPWAIQSGVVEEPANK